MSRTGIVSMVALVAVALVVASCGGDDCPTCPVPDEPIPQAIPPLYVIGSAAVASPPTPTNAPLLVEIDVYNTAGTEHHVEEAYVDSVRLCVSDAPQSTAEDGHARIAYWDIEGCFSGVIPDFTADSTTEFTLYCGGIAHTARLHLLDYILSRPKNVSVTADAAASELRMSWDPVADAEWYAVKIRWKANFSGWHGWEYQCVDSAGVSVPLAMPYSRLFDVNVYVASGSGPRPDSLRRPNNVTGAYVRGAIYSVSQDQHVYLPVTPAPAGYRPPVRVPSLRELLRPGEGVRGS